MIHDLPKINMYLSTSLTMDESHLYGGLDLVDVFMQEVDAAGHLLHALAHLLVTPLLLHSSKISKERINKTSKEG